MINSPAQRQELSDGENPGVSDERRHVFTGPGRTAVFSLLPVGAKPFRTTIVI